MIYYFNINYACNNKCIFCAADISGQTIGEEISINNFKKILEERNVAKGDTVIINGGEPTIHKDFFLFLEEINKRSAKIDLFTNGIKLCDENFAKQVLKFEPLLIRIPVFGKNASSHDMLTGKIGNFNKIAPIKILAITPNTKICGAVNFILLDFSIFPFSSNFVFI